LKKCGNIAQTGVDKAYSTAKLKSGIVGIQVRIMPPNIRLPDDIELIEEVKEVIKEEKEPKKEEAKKEEKEKEPKKAEAEPPKESEK
jgi:small subunit ribosomal protein S3